jgi:hypothetical protein
MRNANSGNNSGWCRISVPVIWRVTPEQYNQLIIINSQHINYVSSGKDNKITEVFQNNITSKDYVALVSLFNDNGFLLMKESYNPPAGIVNDLRNVRLTVNFGNITKSVILEPYAAEYYPDNVRILAEKMKSYLDKNYDLSLEQAKSAAEAWIKSAPTYSYDCSDLTFIDIGQLNTIPITYILRYSFKSAGYGDRRNVTGPQIITTHEITVAINEGQVMGAVIDSKWNELTQAPYEVTLEYQSI